MDYPIHVVTDDENDITKLNGWAAVPKHGLFVYTYNRHYKYAIYTGIKLDDKYAAILTSFGTFYIVSAVTDNPGIEACFLIESNIFTTYSECVQWYYRNIVDYESTATAQPEE